MSWYVQEWLQLISVLQVFKVRVLLSRVSLTMAKCTEWNVYINVTRRPARRLSVDVNSIWRCNFESDKIRWSPCFKSRASLMSLNEHERWVDSLEEISHGSCQDNLTQNLLMRRCSAKFLARLLTEEQKPWRWREQTSSKRWYPTATLHSVTTEKPSTWNQRDVDYFFDYEDVVHHISGLLENILLLRRPCHSVRCKRPQRRDSSECQIRHDNPPTLSAQFMQQF